MDRPRFRTSLVVGRPPSANPGRKILEGCAERDALDRTDRDTGRRLPGHGLDARDGSHGAPGASASRAGRPHEEGVHGPDVPGTGGSWVARRGTELPWLFWRGEPGAPLLPLWRNRGHRLRLRIAPRALSDPPAHGDRVFSGRKYSPQVPRRAGNEERRRGFGGRGDLGAVRPVRRSRRAERRGLTRVYAGYFLRSLLTKVRGKKEILANILDLEAVRASATLRDFDDAATAKLHGFADADDYYRKCSSNQFLQSVRVPTLLLHSLDDPFLPASALPLSAIEANRFLTLVLTEGGGHVGFFEGGTPWNPTFWMEEQSASFLAHHRRVASATTPHANPQVAGRVDPHPENI